MENENTQLPKNQFKNREFTRIFQEIDDEITILTATAKFNHTTCKTDKNTLNLTLAYIDDTKKLVTLLKNRMNLLMQTTL
ncbi:MAG: hypothetical protein ACQCN3_15385 [Candidatus Bathyarchaeia archaeon]|jgi:hypothetical protein